ncbi:zinc-finger-containing protein [Achromobacter veterisilvae]|uniref:Zinc-finger-containing protein n=1 Tax=Achromobacter veterisilvae TaxID=2069367 RepID=A0ABZ2S6H1_9BURK
MSITVLGVDPRSRSKQKLQAPAPLPHVSRRALARVRDRIAPPTACHCCRGPVKLTNNRDIYAGQSFGEWPYVYRCTQCQAYVGLHPDTDLPLGIMASKETIKARKDAKFLFQRLTKERFANNRTAAYAWLAKALGIAPSICHFGMFGHDQADRAADVCRAQLGSRA